MSAWVCQGVGEIGDETRTQCITDPDYAKLSGPALMEHLYSKGVALYASFSISVFRSRKEALLGAREEPWNPPMKDCVEVAFWR